MDGECFALGSVARDGSFAGSKVLIIYLLLEYMSLLLPQLQ